MAILQIPALLWELIFTRPLKWWFHRSCEIHDFIHTLRAQHFTDCLAQLTTLLIFHSYSSLRAHIWQTKSWQIYPSSNGNFIDSCSDSSLCWELISFNSLTFGRPGVGRSTPTFFKWQILTDSYSDNSYFIPTLRAHHLADQVLADLAPHAMVI